MERNKQFEKEKYLRALIKKKDDLFHEMLMTVKVKVPPFKHGWLVKAILREDFARSKDGEFLQTLIDKIFLDRELFNHKYVAMVRKKKYIYRFAKNEYYLDFFPQARSLSEKEYELLTEREKKYFFKSETAYWGHWGGTRTVYQFNLPRHYITTKVVPRYIDYVYQRDPELQSEWQRTCNKADALNAIYLYYGKEKRNYWNRRVYKRAQEKATLLKYSQWEEVY